ncbi:MAG: ABC transporter ATP-binding protein [Pseudomonadota bacterium]
MRDSVPLNGSHNPAVKISDLNFSYDGHLVLEDVNVEIPVGDFVSIVGPNGGGKTTLIKLILGLLKPSTGSVKVFGQSPGNVRTRMGYMPQHSELDFQFPATVMDVALMGRLGNESRFGAYSKNDREIVLASLEKVGLASLRRKSFAEISGGQRQRLFLARALACQPDILLLDEPTANLDLAMEGDLYKLLQELNERLTIVIVSHDLGFVSRVVRTVLCVKRKVLSHPTADITGEIINEIYGAPMKMIRHNGDGGGCDCTSF